MKCTISLVLIILCKLSFTQELPRNSQTGLFFIKDSMEVNDKSLQDVKNIMNKWAYTLIDEGNLNKVYKLNNSKQTEKVSINLPLWSILSQDKGNNIFLTNGTLTYSKTKTKGLAPSVTFGAVKFSFSYSISANKLLYEFTSLEYSHDMVHYGKFEDEKPPSDNYNKSLLLKMSKKEWNDIKVEYFNNLKILSENLKEFANPFLKVNQLSPNKSLINYETYKKLIIGMTYNDVAKLLEDEGKELSNSTSQVNGKSITLQTFIWTTFDKSKSITVTFTDGIISSKSQKDL